jgi:hypothetical protein
MSKAFLGVTNKNKWKTLNPGDKSFWCVSPKYGASIGDLLFLYKTTVGIVQLYTITSLPYITDNFECVMRDMLMVDTQLITIFSNPVTALDMKSNKILSKSGPLGRNFQKTIFEIRDIEGKEIISLLSMKNPNQAEFSLLIK